jgi:FKBP-type peptidyl-prolyl cis-trans isomerase
MKNQKENIGVAVSFIVVACIIGLVFYILMNKKEDKGLELPEIKISDKVSESSPQDNTMEQREENSEPQTNKMEKISKNGDVLVMNYTGRLEDGTVFDSNVLPKFNHVEPFKFTLGAGQVIQGWDEGLLGMKIGEKKTLTIPPEKGYGSRAVSTIPANSTLIFEVELVGIE